MTLLRTLSIAIALSAATIATSAVAEDSPADIYNTKCQICHGANGKASSIGKNMGAKDVSDPDFAKKSDAELTTATENGKGKMLAFKGKLSSEQTSLVVKYMKDLK